MSNMGQERITFTDTDMALALTLMLPRLRSGIEHDLHMARWVADEIGLPLPSLELSIAQMQRDVAAIEAIPDRLKQLATVEAEIDVLILRKASGCWIISSIENPSAHVSSQLSEPFLGAQP
ncbi:hypothetical protein HNR60_001515 [Rhodopseudomonas rhenobacensis]|uniref:Uncharacterized protein n=1 Tax=Rhodopseudomonas rhenobacensis TaxID=87461 RepID=A0A7W7Z334_9BRAD|nr:hypothetical protein [Rhodopseudomonas rhenobacensis]MBB5046767.1 hypothetical protein [Rhodopseudomonas rhenobacensis]